MTCASPVLAPAGSITTGATALALAVRCFNHLFSILKAGAGASDWRGDSFLSTQGA
jgi:hypothetical protein